MMVDCDTLECKGSTFSIQSKMKLFACKYINNINVILIYYGNVRNLPLKIVQWPWRIVRIEILNTLIHESVSAPELDPWMVSSSETYPSLDPFPSTESLSTSFVLAMFRFNGWKPFRRVSISPTHSLLTLKKSRLNSLIKNTQIDSIKYNIKSEHIWLSF